MKKYIALALSVSICLSNLSITFAKPVDGTTLPKSRVVYPSEHTKKYISVSNVLKIGINIGNQNFQRTITRQDLAHIAVGAYEYIVNDPSKTGITDAEIAQIKSQYADLDNGTTTTFKAIKYGIMNNSGTKGNLKIFNPTAIANVEQSSVVLANILSKSGLDISLTPLNSYSDAKNVSSWATDSMGRLNTLSAVYSLNNNLYPKKNIAYEDFIKMTIQTVDAIDDIKPLPYDTALLLNTLEKPEMYGSSLYTDFYVSNFSSDSTLSDSDEIAYAYAVDTLLNNGEYERYIYYVDTYNANREFNELKNSLDNNYGYNKEYNDEYGLLEIDSAQKDSELLKSTIRVSAIDKYGVVSDKFNEISEYTEPSYETEQEALADMKTITFNVWNLKNGKKVTEKRSLTVHKGIADEVLSIFAEIYNGPEKFPIKDIGAFSFRPGQHKLGLAIDINSNENYYISPTQQVGSYWKPNEDPYSIKPDGDVVRAFDNHGWGWGGLGWGETYDYMHFSVNGN